MRPALSHERLSVGLGIDVTASEPEEKVTAAPGELGVEFPPTKILGHGRVAGLAGSRAHTALTSQCTADQKVQRIGRSPLQSAVLD